jgi:hypothetical protein
MAFSILVAGLGFSLGGALVVSLADAWLSRSVLIYLDAVEANVGKVVEALRAGTIDAAVTGINLQRDRGQDRARILKSLGWLALALGFGLQIAGALLGLR